MTQTLLVEQNSVQQYRLLQRCIWRK